jgi:hypothetical protein
MKTGEIKEIPVFYEETEKLLGVFLSTTILLGDFDAKLWM